MYGDILIPTDGSDEIVGAIEHGVALADRYEATVHALSVVDPGAAEDLITDASLWEPVYESRTEAAHRATAEVKEHAADHGVSVVESVRDGDPTREIVAYADEHADLITMGTHGRTGLSRYLVGSVTTSVVQSASVPVLSTHLSNPPQTMEYSDILIATDGTDGSADAAEHAIMLSYQHEATLHALYVVDSKLGTDTPVQNVLEQDGERAVSEVTAAAEANGVTTVEQIVTGVPSKEINAAVDEHDAELLVVGTHGRTGLDRLVLGSVAERLIRTADVPVLTVRATDEA